MPSGVASPACSAIVQHFLRGRSASNPNRTARIRRRHSIRPNRPAIRSVSSSTPTDQPAGLPWPARPPRDCPMSTHLTMVTRWPPSSADQDQAIYGWSTSLLVLQGQFWPRPAKIPGGPTPSPRNDQQVLPVDRGSSPVVLAKQETGPSTMSELPAPRQTLLVGGAVMSITALDIARGFNFDGIDPAVHLSEFLVDHWGTLSADDRYLVTQHLWDGLNNYVDFVKTGMGNRGATPEE